MFLWLMWSNLCASVSYTDGPLPLCVDMTFIRSYLWGSISHSDGLLSVCFYDSCGPIYALEYPILMDRCPYVLWLSCRPIFELEYHIAMDCYLYVLWLMWSHLCASISYTDGPLSLFVDMTFTRSHLCACLSHSDGLLSLYVACGLVWLPVLIDVP
jgi:hypothetical protein